MMKISVITVAFNSAATIESTILSVLAQKYSNIEFIIIDGKSTDDTMSIIDRFKNKIQKIISEKDSGIYDAMNKGLRYATGDVVGFLHSDDVYASDNVLSEVAGLFKTDDSLEAVYGDLQYVDRQNSGKVIRKWTAGEYRKDKFLEGWMPPHPTFFVKRTCYDKYGMFNTEFRISADYEIMLRFIYKNEIKIKYIPQVLVKMKVGGESNVSVKNRIIANIEDRKAWKINGLTPRIYTLILKPLSKLSQWIMK